MTGLLLAAGTTAVNQDYLFQARQMQALSLAVHIPLVCFGIAFPALVLYVEGLYLRTGDPLYRTLAMRWSKIMITLFAVGVVTGTILSFEFGLLWPEFMAAFGNVFGLGFAFEGFSFFLEAIFVAIYVYGWDRISPRKHFACGVVVVITGLTGSLMVIAVNGWMNHPSGFRLVNGKAVDVHPWSALFGNSYFWHELVHMYVAGYIVTGFVLASRLRVGRAARALGPLREDRARDPARGRGDRGAGAADRRRLGGARRHREAADEARGARGPRHDDEQGADPHPRLVRRRGREVRDRDPAPALVPRQARPERDRRGARRRAAPTGRRTRR